MKYTTRWVLSIAIAFLSINSLVIFKDIVMFGTTTYPVIVGWVIGELLNIPETIIPRKWERLKNRIKGRWNSIKNYFKTKWRITKDELIILLSNMLANNQKEEQEEK